MIVGQRTPEELEKLLWTGYFVNGQQRITYEGWEGAPFPKIYLWDDWERRESHLWASTLAVFIEAARIDLSSWHWYPNSEGTS